MAQILNAIIRIGGTTAFEEEKTASELCDWYLTGDMALCCHVACTPEGEVVGFQSLGTFGELPSGWADIGTFVDPLGQRGGAGRLLFDTTTAAARQRGIVTINATIRADNVPGLGYYARRGFVDYGADPDYRLADGTRVGRVHKRFDLT